MKLVLSGETVQLGLSKKWSYN